MIQIRFKITLPLLALMLLGLFIWLVRNPDSKRQWPTKQRPPYPRRSRSHTRPARTILFTGVDDDREPPEHITYADALRSGDYSPDELAAIGNREAMEAGRSIYEHTQHMNQSMPTPTWRK